MTFKKRPKPRIVYDGKVRIGIDPPSFEEYEEWFVDTVKKLKEIKEEHDRGISKHPPLTEYVKGYWAGKHSLAKKLLEASK